MATKFNVRAGNVVRMDDGDGAISNTRRPQQHASISRIEQQAGIAQPSSQKMTYGQRKLYVTVRFCAVYGANATY